jgi:DNA polymerase alpha subunit B
MLLMELSQIPPLKPSPAALGIINPKLDPAVAQNSATMFVACGPYTADTDLSHKPWRGLFNEIKAKKPDVVLLVIVPSLILNIPLTPVLQIGPFIDSTHTKIKIGDMDVSPSNLFKAFFADRIKNFLESSPGSIVLLVPSVRDLVSDHAAFPQPELSMDVFLPNNLPISKAPYLKRVQLLPNPARFTINDISFATTSVDTLFHLRKEEYFKRALDIEPLDPAADDLPNDAMAGLVRHLLLQRRSIISYLCSSNAHMYL